MVSTKDGRLGKNLQGKLLPTQKKTGIQFGKTCQKSVSPFSPWSGEKSKDSKIHRAEQK